MLLDLLQIVEIQLDIFQLRMMIALECSLVNITDYVVVQFERSQIGQKMKTRITYGAQMVVAQIKLSQRIEKTKRGHGKSGQ